MPKRKRPIRVRERKLRRECAKGFAYVSEGLIEIDPRQRPRSYLNTLVHEVLHFLCPERGESWIARSACRITRTVWEAGYRKIAK